mmetsp:Transcript_27389/g.51400  ORF Transcript_27389/g.51400 Transcript_27389/m.51400 type:complete len:109 (-) Transcript_27389:16-342(-)
MTLSGTLFIATIVLALMDPRVLKPSTYPRRDGSSFLKIHFKLVRGLMTFSHSYPNEADYQAFDVYELTSDKLWKPSLCTDDEYHRALAAQVSLPPCPDPPRMIQLAFY